MKINELAFGYKRSRGPVLHGLTWQVPHGRTALLGPNGAGKSTLMLLCSGAQRPWHGTISSAGHAAYGSRRDRREFRAAVGWMPQRSTAVPGLTGREQVAYSGWLKGMSRSDAWHAAMMSLETVGLGDRANVKARTYSGGQLRRLGLAQVLVHSPRVLLLDEPTVGLDPSQRSRFREVFSAAVDQHDLAVLVSTHQVDDITDAFDRVAVFLDGAVRYEGTSEEFLSLGRHADPAKAAEMAYASVAGVDV